MILVYYLPVNGIVERGYRSFKDTLAKLTEGGKLGWVNYLYAVLLVDWTTVRGPTGCTLFYLNYSREAVLLIEMDIPTWRLLDWPSVKSREELLALRARQLLRRDKDLEEATLRL